MVYMIDNTRVYTLWDFGYTSTYSIIFFQIINNEIGIVDYYENNEKPLSHYMETLDNKGYNYHKHFTDYGISYLYIKAKFGLNLIPVRGANISFGNNEKIQKLIIMKACE